MTTTGNGFNTIWTGEGSDTIRSGDGDLADGGTGGDDVDTLDLTGADPFVFADRTVDADGDSTSGTIDFLDSTGVITGSMRFREIERFIPCFTLGTAIADHTRFPGRWSSRQGHDGLAQPQDLGTQRADRPAIWRTRGSCRSKAPGRPAGYSNFRNMFCRL